MRLYLEEIKWKYLDSETHQWISDIIDNEVHPKVIRSLPQRSVVFFENEVYIKEIRYKKLRSLIKGVFQGNACEEGKKLLKLSKLGIPVPQVLGFGEEKHFLLLKRDILATRSIPDAIPMSDYLRTQYLQIGSDQKKKLIRSLALFIKSLHEAGIFQEDLHIGNIMIKSMKGDYSFFLLDAHNIGFYPGELSLHEKARNLAILLSGFWTLSTIRERLRFLTFYGINLDSEEGKNFVRSVERLALIFSGKVWRKKARRCLYNNNRFCKEKSGNFKIYRTRDPLSKKILNKLLPDPDKILEKIPQPLLFIYPLIRSRPHPEFFTIVGIQ
jgi:tRNA A-37 threonylcarbamoyl transferase component Bud32